MIRQCRERYEEDDHRGEPGDEPGESAGDAPEGEEAGVEPAEVHAVGQPADGDLHGGVRPEEGREKDAHARGAEMEVGGDGGEGDGEDGAVEVIDEPGEEEKEGD